MSDNVFHDRNGRAPCARSPRGAQPCSRRIPVLQYDSSRKTSRRCRIALTNMQKALRLSRCSGVSRSVAMKDFFSGVGETLEGAPDRRRARLHEPSSDQPLRDLIDRRIRLLTHQHAKDFKHLATERREVAAATRRWRDRAGLAMPAQHATYGRFADREQRRDFLVAQLPIVERPHDRLPDLLRNHDLDRSRSDDPFKWGPL